MWKDYNKYDTRDVLRKRIIEETKNYEVTGKQSLLYEDITHTYIDVESERIADAPRPEKVRNIADYSLFPIPLWTTI